MSKPGKKNDKTNTKSNIPILGKAGPVENKNIYEVSTPALYNTKYKVICPGCGEDIIFTVNKRTNPIICGKCSAYIMVNAVEKNANEGPKAIYNQDPEDADIDDNTPGDKKEDTNYRYDNHDDEPASTPGNNQTNEGTNYQEQKQKEEPGTIYDHNQPDERTNLKEQQQEEEPGTIYWHNLSDERTNLKEQQQEEEPGTEYGIPKPNKGKNANRQKQHVDPPTEYGIPKPNKSKDANRQKQGNEQPTIYGDPKIPPVETPPEGGYKLNRQPESDAKLVWWSHYVKRRKYILRMGKNYIGRRDDERPSDLSLEDEHASARSICIEVTKKYPSRGIPNQGIETYEYRLTVERATNSVLLCGREVPVGTTIDLMFGDTIVLGKTTLTLSRK